jgi:hypothetical protein
MARYQQVDIRKHFSLKARTNFIKARKYKPVMNIARNELEMGNQSEEQ